jgi:hypothetical protein
MRLSIVVVVLAALSISTAAAEAATRHKRRVPKPIVAPSYQVVTPVASGLWGDRCTTDDGYGRRLPCDYSGK